MTYATIEYTVDDAVAVITLNRPDRLNALNTALVRELLDVFEAVADDDGVRAVLLRANGRAFSSGADLKEAFQNNSISELDLGSILRARYHPLIEAMHALEKPIVGAVQGLAAGAGCSLALATDMVVAGRSGAFQQIFSNIGLVPDAGSSYFLPQLIGHGKALGTILTGQVIDAETAERWGMIWQVVDDDALDASARELAQTLAARPTRALGLAKQNLRAADRNNLTEQLELEAQTQSRVQHTADFGEAIQAFLEKRPAHFIGK